MTQPTAYVAPVSRVFLLLAGSLAVAACGPSPQATQLAEAVAADAARQGPATSVALRFASRRGGDVRLYRLPTLDEATWRFETPGLVARQVVGFADDDDLIYVLTPDSTLVALDLNSGRPRTADSAVILARLSPSGVPLYVRADGSILRQLGRRSTVLAESLEVAIEGVWAGARDRALATTRSAAGRRLTPLGTESDSGRALPDGPLDVAPGGDLLAVGSDRSLLITSLLRRAPDEQIALRAAPTVVAFSPSGHRIYVATDAGEILTIERFGLDIIARTTLPMAAIALRVDPRGARLLARPAVGDSVWLISLVDPTPPVSIASEWTDDLPAIAPDGTIMVRRGTDVVTIAADSRRELARAADPGQDRWLIVAWDPRRPALQLADEQAARSTTGDRLVYLQVSSTTNQTWADDLARDLRLAGMRSAVLQPTRLDEMFRVVIGPYATREEAEEAGRGLGMPYWIFTQSTSPDST
ncbi:MAG TPA: SPOR domain-containing protein [Gemmatimonadales bacterium]